MARANMLACSLLAMLVSLVGCGGEASNRPSGVASAPANAPPPPPPMIERPPAPIANSVPPASDAPFFMHEPSSEMEGETLSFEGDELPPELIERMKAAGVPLEFINPDEITVEENLTEPEPEAPRELRPVERPVEPGASPEEVARVYLDSMKAQDANTALGLLTEKARLECQDFMISLEDVEDPFTGIILGGLLALHSVRYTLGEARVDGEDAVIEGSARAPDRSRVRVRIRMRREEGEWCIYYETITTQDEKREINFENPIQVEFQNTGGL